MFCYRVGGQTSACANLACITSTRGRLWHQYRWILGSHITGTNDARSVGQSTWRLYDGPPVHWRAMRLLHASAAQVNLVMTVVLLNNPSQQQLSLLGLKESPQDLCPIVGFRRDLGELRGSKREHKLALSQSALKGFLLTNLWVWSLNMPVGSLGLLKNNFYISFYFSCFSRCLHMRWPAKELKV